MDGVGLEDLLLGTIEALQPLADSAAHHLGELFSTWWWLIAIVAIVGVLVILRVRRFRKSRSRYPRSYPVAGSSGSAWARSDASRLGDPTAQQEFIRRVEFAPRRLLNKPEYRILQILEKVVREVGGGHRVMAQTSLGEVIKPRSAMGSDEELAFHSINSKRLDFLVIDRTGMPALAVEYQGHGHYQNNRAFQRDAVKREAVRKANIPFLEIPAEYDVAVEANRIRSALEPRPAREERRIVSPIRRDRADAERSLR